MVQNIKTYRFFITFITYVIGIFVISAAQAQTLNRTNMEGANISILFDYEPIGNDHEWRYGVIDVALKPHWKTYWKNSGNSGLAPQLEFKQPIKAELLFSAPHLLRDGNDWAYIYQDHTQIIFRLAASELKNTPLTGDLLIGICNTICAPVNVAFSFNEKSSNSFINRLKIQTALNTLPSKPNNQFYIQSLHQKNKNLEVTLHAPNDDKDVELFLYANKIQLGVAKAIDHQKNTIVFSAPILSGNLTDDQKIDFIAKKNDTTIAGSVNFKQH